MPIDVIPMAKRLVARHGTAVAVAATIATLCGALHAVDTARRAAEQDAAWLRQRLVDKRALVRALQGDLADVAQTTERVSQMASVARDENAAVRRLAGIAEPRGARYTPARLAALDDATANRSDEGARAIAQLAFLEEQLAATTDSLALMTALAAPNCRTQPAKATAPRTAVADATVPGGWPVVGEVSSRFGWRESPYGTGTQRHTGLDIRAGYGTPVHASAPGVVVFAGRDSGGYGTTVVVDHGHDLKTLYGHLSAVYVRGGQRVARGTVIGAVGNTGRATGVHLHYEVRVDNVPVDPMRYVRAGSGVQQVALR